MQLYHTHYTIPEQNNKVNLFSKMPKAFILINDVKQFSNFMTLTSNFASKKSENRAWRRSPLPSFWNQKKCPDFVKKEDSNCVHPWVKFSIQNEVLSISRRKSSKIFPHGTFFYCIFGKRFIEVPWFYETSPAHKISGCMPG